jgi:hypothetical protein
MKYVKRNVRFTAFKAYNLLFAFHELAPIVFAVAYKKVWLGKIHGQTGENPEIKSKKKTQHSYP